MTVETPFEDPFDVVAVGAHPDDVEIACGGTLAKLVDQGYRVGIIDLTDGEPTPGSESPEERLAEAREAANVLGVDLRITMDLPNRRLFDNFENRVALAILFRKLRPRVVIGFGDKTPLASPDHHQAMMLTDAAIFYSRLCKWDEHFEHLPVHVIEKQLYFRLAFEPQSLHGFGGEFTCDISDTLERKLKSIRCYRSQFPSTKEYVFERVSSVAKSVGSAAGVGAGEVFINVRPVMSSNLMHTLFPNESSFNPESIMESAAGEGKSS